MWKAANLGKRELSKKYVDNRDRRGVANETVLSDHEIVINIKCSFRRRRGWREINIAKMKYSLGRQWREGSAITMLTSR